LSLFRQAQNDYGQLFEACARRRFQRVALVGAGDLAQIVLLVSRDHPVEITAIIDAEAKRTTDTFHGVPVFAALAEAPAMDAYVISSLTEPQVRYDELVTAVDPARVLAPALLDLTTGSFPSGGED